MYFKRKSNVIFRNYNDFGYITDNRNFGYQQENNADSDIGDRIVSQSGAIFLSVLENEPQTLDELAQAISRHYGNVDIEIIKNDAREFYNLLDLDGFIISGETQQECNVKDTGFSYQGMMAKHEREDCSLTGDFRKDTQEYFEQYFQGKPQLTNLHIEVTSACNERCVHCYIPHEDKTTFIEPNLFYNILEQSREMHLLHLTISGGEPLMHKYFIDFLDKCNEYNFSVNVLSNLTLLNGDTLAAMKRNRLLSVQVSLYAMDANIHDAITQVKGSFEKTRNAILRLWENNIPMQISCPIMKQNIDCYHKVVEWGRIHNIKVGSDYVIIAKYNHTVQNLKNRLSVHEIEELIYHQIAHEPHYLELVETEAAKRRSLNPDDPVCSVCHSSICIADNGNIFPCAGWQDYIVGNVNETSLDEAWNNSKMIKYLRNLRKRDFPRCIQCPDKEFCTMCMVRNANEHPLGDPLVVNEFFCNIARINKKMVLERKNNVANS